LDTYPEQPFATAEKPILPARADFSSDPDTHTIRSFVYGQDPPPVLITDGTEQQEIHESVKTLSRHKFRPFRPNPFQSNKGEVQFRNMFEMTGRGHNHLNPLTNHVIGDKRKDLTIYMDNNIYCRKRHLSLTTLSKP
jgi:hypothetical protein